MAFLSGKDDKADKIALDIGAMFTRAGFCGEVAPRHIASNIQFEAVVDGSVWPEGAERKHHVSLANGHISLLSETVQPLPINKPSSVATLAQTLKRHLQNIFFNLLQTDPKGKRVVLADSPLQPLWFKQLIAQSLFELAVQSITVLPSPLLAVFASGKDAGLVVDSGFTETSVVPIFDGRPIMSSLTSAPVGTRAVIENLRSIIAKHGLVVNHDGSTTPAKDLALTTVQLDELRSVYVTGVAATAGQGHVDISIDEKRKIRLPNGMRHVAADVLFSGNDEDASIASAICESLLKCDRDLRSVVVGNIMLIGGAATTVAFSVAVQRAVIKLVQSTKRYEALQWLLPKFHYASTPFQPNTVVWVGASLSGVMKTHGFDVTKEAFAANSNALPDWSFLAAHAPSGVENVIPESD